MSQEIVQIPFRDKVVNLHFEEFESDIDIDRLTCIDYNNLYAEFITIPALMNRTGIWRAEAEHAYADFKLKTAIFEAERADHYRRTLIKDVPDARGNLKKKFATIDEVADAVTLDADVQLYRSKLSRLRKEADYMDSLYWSVKSKEGKLNKISESMKLTPEDFERELIEGKWNGILIQSKRKAIPG